MQIAILTVSDRASAGTYEDATGPALVELCNNRTEGFTVMTPVIVPDERNQIVEQVKAWRDEGIELILTNGGTGLTERDITPEALGDVIDRAVPGLAEAMRAAGRAKTPMADLSRQVAGQAGASLVIALPGSVKGATESLDAIIDVLPHAIEMIRQ